jgi:hypothetical protein
MAVKKTNVKNITKKTTTTTKKKASTTKKKTTTSSTKKKTTTTTKKNTTKTVTGSMSDGKYSTNTLDAKYTNTTYIENNADDIFDFIRRSHGLYQRKDIDIFNRRYRFGLFNPYETLTTTREFLFFTKPDLNIYTRNETSGTLTGSMNSALTKIPYWQELKTKYMDVIKCLQLTKGKKNDPFNHLLENMCISNIAVPSLDAETIETPNNMYGVGFSYRGSSEASNDNFDFDLEFKDTKYLPVYQFFKAYEEYETLKHHGTIGPWKGYIQDKVLHDQFALYKFLVAEDMETIIYYAKYYGVMPKSLPRDVFSSESFDSGLSYSISFKCAFFDDMDPVILNDFNALSKTYYDSLKYRIDVYNDVMDRMDNRPTQAAYITSASDSNAPGGKVYKLKWKGSDKY